MVGRLLIAPLTGSTSFRNPVCGPMDSDEHPHGVRAEDQPLWFAIEGEAAVEELRSLLAPVAAPITLGTVGAVAVEGGVDIEGVESGHVGLLAFATRSV